jgi:hypothetical protein
VDRGIEELEKERGKRAEEKRTKSKIRDDTKRRLQGR